MTLRHWEPARELDEIHRTMDRPFHSFSQPLRFSMLGDGLNAGHRLPLDVYEEGDSLVIKADVPGMKPEDVKVEVTGNMLMVRGQARDEHEDKQPGYYVRERRYGSFQRSVGLPSDLNTDKVEAAFENGVLSIRIPKSEAAKTKTVKVISKK